MANMASNLDDKVRESLRDKILEGALSGGAHLSELKLSKEFNVSRTPIREALCALAADGLVEMVPHRGAFVRERTASSVEDQSNVYGHLMALAARLATEKAGIEDLMELENAINAMESQDEKGFTQVAQTVTSMVRKVANSPILDEMLSTVERRMQPEDTHPKGTKADLMQDYTFLLGAFKRRKADAAEKTMRQLMDVTAATPTETTTETQA